MKSGKQVWNLTDASRQTRVAEVCQSLAKIFKHLMLQ
jgi:hypothetical protein